MGNIFSSHSPSPSPSPSPAPLQARQSEPAGRVDAAGQAEAAPRDEPARRAEPATRAEPFRQAEPVAERTWPGRVALKRDVGRMLLIDISDANVTFDARFMLEYMRRSELGERPRVRHFVVHHLPRMPRDGVATTAKILLAIDRDLEQTMYLCVDNAAARAGVPDRMLPEA
ncbi:hypothetical protein PaG_03464 [Moesziomyces aphidis]|uniref:Uncharacterized protein n=1 Tax=Moesziomyces aphidis TaxID=84754 RepID=W3VL40_MOEAP|nr:hypothetical protein PaG_03464 [Moesziomyces aphidis]